MHKTEAGEKAKALKKDARELASENVQENSR